MTFLPAPLTPVRRLSASLVTGAAVALVTHVVTVLIFFVVGSADPAALAGLTSVFLPSTLILFILIAVAASVGAFRSWPTTLGAGLISSLVAALIGYGSVFVSAGQALTSESLLMLIQAMAGPHLVFILTATVVALTVGRRVWRGMVGEAASGARTVERRVALVRAPVARLAEGEITHIERTPVDVDLAASQWENYVSALDEAGWEIAEVPAAEDHPDSVFIEDTVIMFGSLAVIASLGVESRVGESEAVERVARERGQHVERITVPGTLDGGDVLKVGMTVFVGRGGRTNAEGIRQLRSLIAPYGYTVVAVPMSRALHLKTAATALPDGTVIGAPDLLDAATLFERFLPVPEHAGTAVVVLDAETVLISAAAPLTAEMIRELGYRVVTVDISEFEKMEGCVTCLSVRIR